VAVLGASVRKQLFEGRPALGQEIRINGYPYRVIGLMSEKQQNSSYDGWDNDKVLIPISSLRRDAPPYREAYEMGRLDAIIYRPVSVKDWEEAQRQARRAVGTALGFSPEDKSALFLWDTMESAERFDKVFNATEIFLGVVAFITLTLGGVGVMNTMMMAVAERTPEVGLKKALGATSKRILLDFLLEGMLLAALSGAAGMSVVWVLTSLVNRLPMPPMWAGLPVDQRTALLAVAALGSVAVLSALPPAWRASRLTPVEALRMER
jgi:putative ABC transport system permease protein